MAHATIETAERLQIAVAEEDRQVTHRSWKQRAIAWISLYLFGWCVFTVRHGINKGRKWKGGLGWLPFGLREEPEAMFWRKLSEEGRLRGHVWDVGAHVGVMSLFFAKTAQKVLAFEPVAFNRKRLAANMQLNALDGKVRIIGKAVGAREDLVSMSVDRLSSGCSAIARAGSGSANTAVYLTSIDHMILAGEIAPAFIKIDVEGYEVDVLQGALDTLRKYRPDVFVELHGETIRLKRQNASAVLDLLEQAGFRRIFHVESGRYISRGERDPKIYQGHFYGSWQ